MYYVRLFALPFFSRDLILLCLLFIFNILLWSVSTAAATTSSSSARLFSFSFSSTPSFLLLLLLSFDGMNLMERESWELWELWEKIWPWVEKGRKNTFTHTTPRGDVNPYLFLLLFTQGGKEHGTEG
jgi:hypothetical protein